MRPLHIMRVGALLLGMLGSTVACGAESAPGPVPVGGGPAPNSAPASKDPAAQTAPWDRQIVRSGTINLEVADVEASLAAVRQMAGAASGWVSSSSCAS